MLLNDNSDQHTISFHPPSLLMSDNLCEIRKELDEQMHSKCSKQWNEYEACGKRLEERGFPEGETCEGWYCDYLGCLDNHVGASFSSITPCQQKLIILPGCQEALCTIKVNCTRPSLRSLEPIFSIVVHRNKITTIRWFVLFHHRSPR